MMTEMDDPMVLESNLAARAREKQEAVSRNVVFENSFVDSPASGAMDVTGQVVGMETSPPALTHSPVGDNMSKHGDGAQTESAQEQELALPTKPTKPSGGCRVIVESSSFSSPNSGNFNDNVVEGTVVKCRIRRKNWGQKETDDVLGAVLNTPKVRTRMEQGTDNDSYWNTVADAVRGRTGHECRGRMDTLKRSFSTMKNYCDGELKEFKQLNEEDFGKMKVSPRLSEDWYNQIRDSCPPKPKKKLKTNGAGSSSKSTGFVPDTLTLGLPPPVVPDGIDQGEPAMVVCASPNSCLLKLLLSFYFPCVSVVSCHGSLKPEYKVANCSWELAFVFNPQNINTVKFVFLRLKLSWWTFVRERSFAVSKLNFLCLYYVFVAS